MITDTGARIFSMRLSYPSSRNKLSASVVDVTGTSGDLDSVNVGMIPSINNQFVASTTSDLNRQFLRVGVGTAPESRTDYCLTEELDGVNINGASYIQCNSYRVLFKDSYDDAYKAVDGGYAAFECSFINNSSDTITVSEFGWFAAGGRTVATARFFLLARYLLDTPITFEPGDSKLLTAKMQFNI